MYVITLTGSFIHFESPQPSIPTHGAGPGTSVPHTGRHDRTCGFTRWTDVRIPVRPKKLLLIRAQAGTIRV